MTAPARKPMGLARRLVVLVAAVAIVLGAAFVVNQRWATIRNWWFDADREDSTQLAGLATAPLQTPTSAPSGGWPQWFGPNRDGVAPPGPLRTDWAANPPKVLWTAPCGGGYSSFAVVGNKVYTTDRKGEEDRLLCLDAATGKELGVYANGVQYTGVGYGAGPRATPAVDGNRVYVFGAMGVLECLQPPPHEPDAPATRTRWMHLVADEYVATTPQWGFASSPLIEGDLVIVQAGGKQGSVVAFDKVSGQPRWAAGSDPNGYSSPVAATLAGVRQIVAVTGKSVLGVRPADGKVLWTYPWSTEFMGNIATPVIVGDYVFVSSSYNKGCALLKVSADGDGAKAAEVYFRKNRVMRTHHSTCVHLGGYLYGFDESDLRCVDLRKGTQVADWLGRDAANRNLPKGTVILAGGQLLGLTEKGTLFLADADPAEFRLRGEVKGVLSGSDCWALPVLADGRVYLRDHEKVVCVDVR